MTELPAYLTGLVSMLVLVGLTAFRHKMQREQVLRSAAAILFNWIAGSLYVSFTEDYTPWHFSIFIDAICAFIVMWQPAGRVQGFIGLFYFLQIAGHTAFGLRYLTGYPNDPIFYYDAITYVAWAQLLAMGAWCVGIWGSPVFRFVRDRVHAVNPVAGSHSSRDGL